MLPSFRGPRSGAGFCVSEGLLATTYFAYLDEFGHIGPYISRTHPRYKTSPVFGLAGFVLPAAQVRSLGTWFFQRKCQMLDFEIQRSGEHPAVWEKKGASLFTVTNVRWRLSCGAGTAAPPAQRDIDILDNGSFSLYDPPWTPWMRDWRHCRRCSEGDTRAAESMPEQAKRTATPCSLFEKGTGREQETSIWWPRVSV